jgi:hypothetical protein
MPGIPMPFSILERPVCSKARPFSLKGIRPCALYVSLSAPSC